jgi:hypothetical protein
MQGAVGLIPHPVRTLSTLGARGAAIAGRSLAGGITRSAVDATVPLAVRLAKGPCDRVTAGANRLLDSRAADNIVAGAFFGTLALECLLAAISRSRS